MKKLVAVVMVLLIGAAVYFAYFYHLVRAKDGFHVLKKEEPTFAETYLDTTRWGVFDYARFPHITKAILRGKYDDFSKEFSRQMEGLQKQGDALLAQANEALRDTEKLQAEMDKIKRQFTKKFEALKRKYKNMDTEKAVKAFKKEKDELVEWLQDQLKELESENGK